MKVLRFLLSMTLGIVLPLLVQRWDKRFLSPERRHAAWNNVSWAAALYNFGPLSMLGWVWVTRQSFRAWRERHILVALGMTVGLLAIGCLTAAMLFGTIVGIDWCVGWLGGAAE